MLEKYKDMSVDNFWSIMFEKFMEAFPNLCRLGELFLCLPPTSVDAERGFSSQNIIKTALRSNLTISNLNNLMYIKIEGPSIEQFDFETTFINWCNVKDRRIFQQSISLNRNC